MDGTHTTRTLTATKSYADPRSWGQVYWAQIHLSTFFLYKDPDKPTPREKKIAKLYFRYVLPALLPCASCRRHYVMWIKNKIDKILCTRDNAIVGFYLLHESVNERLGKKGINLSDFFRKYEYVKSGYCNKESDHYNQKACHVHRTKRFKVVEDKYCKRKCSKQKLCKKQKEMQKWQDSTLMQRAESLLRTLNTKKPNSWKTTRSKSTKKTRQTTQRSKSSRKQKPPSKRARRKRSKSRTRSKK